MNQWVRWLRDGRRIVWEGQEAIIVRMGAMVQLQDGQGNRLPDVPLCDFALGLRSEQLPAPDQPRAFALEQKMSPSAAKRFARDQALLWRLQTGLKPGEPVTATPPPELNPRLHTLAERTTTLAKMRAQTPRKNGREQKHLVDWRSERRRLERILQRHRTGGVRAFVDPRLLSPRRVQQADNLLDELATFLESRRTKSTTSVSALIVLFRKHCKDNAILPDLPSDRTLRDRIGVLRARREEFRGSAAARISAGNRPSPAERQRLTSRAGELVLFDTTTVNVWVVDPITGETYRPELTIAVDHYTRAIVGMSVTKTTAAFGVVLCLADVLRPKTTALVTEWTDEGEQPATQPYVGVPAGVAWFPGFRPEAVGVDNGMPFRAAYTSGEMARIGTSYEPQRALTPTDKAQVERTFRSIKDLFESLADAYTGGSVHEKGADPRAEAVWTGEEYERRIRQFIDLYNHRAHSGLQHERDPYATLSPYIMWALSLEETGMMPDVTAVHEWIRFLPSVQATISASSLTVKRLKYKSVALRDMQRDGGALDGNKIRVFYDPSDLRRTYCFDGNGTLHTLRWDKLTDHTPRFGETATNWLHRQVIERAPTPRQFTELLIDLLTRMDTDAADVTEIRRRDIGERLVGMQTDRLRNEDTEPILDEDPFVEDAGERTSARPASGAAPRRRSQRQLRVVFDETPDEARNDDGAAAAKQLAPVTSIAPRKRLRQVDAERNGW